MITLPLVNPSKPESFHTDWRETINASINTSSILYTIFVSVKRLDNLFDLSEMKKAQLQNFGIYRLPPVSHGSRDKTEMI
jgi:hypothetical protein